MAKVNTTFVPESIAAETIDKVYRDLSPGSLIVSDMVQRGVIDVLTKLIAGGAGMHMAIMMLDGACMSQERLRAIADERGIELLSDDSEPTTQYHHGEKNVRTTNH